MLLKFENQDRKRARLESWHRKFALLPVPLGNGQFAWMETVLRKAVYAPHKPNDNILMGHTEKAEWKFLHWSYRRAPKNEV